MQGFRIVSVFSAQLDSIMDTCTASVCEAPCRQARVPFVFTPKMLGILVDMDQMDSYGDVGKDCALAFLGMVLEFIAFVR